MSSDRELRSLGIFGWGRYRLVAIGVTDDVRARHAGVTLAVVEQLILALRASY